MFILISIGRRGYFSFPPTKTAYYVVSVSKKHNSSTDSSFVNIKSSNVILVEPSSV